MMFKTGALEVSSEIRSVPLGAKRKRGRPKKMPNCLTKSPVGSLKLNHVIEPEESFIEPEKIGLWFWYELCPLASRSSTVRSYTVRSYTVRSYTVRSFTFRCSTNSSKIFEEKKIVPWQDQSEATKEKRQTSCQPEPPAPSAPPPPTSSSSLHKQPKAKICKKRKGTCTHIMVFDKHYGSNDWEDYANKVRNVRSVTEIDPNYVS